MFFSELCISARIGATCLREPNVTEELAYLLGISLNIQISINAPLLHLIKLRRHPENNLHPVHPTTRLLSSTRVSESGLISVEPRCSVLR